MNRPVYKLLDWIDISKLDWQLLSSNKNAIELLKENPDKIDWYELSINTNAIELIKANLNKIDWEYVSLNPNTIELLKENQDKINWKRFSANPSIFELDYKKMRENNQDMYEDLIKEVMKPSRVFKNPDYDYIEELFGD